MSNDRSAALRERVAAAAAEGGALAIIGSGSKGFLGRRPAGAPLEVGDHTGIVSYEPKELVVTARCGTPLTELEATLAEQGQMLPFEPPHFGPAATLGGAIATGLSGPRRPYSGSARDFVLGVRLLSGRGESLRFGGEVMKNVAGYDISRLVTGAYGTLGVVLDASIKVMPKPEQETTRAQACTAEEAIATMNAWAGQPLPISGTCFDGERLYVRLSGAASAVAAAADRLGGEPVADGHRFWTQIREQSYPFFEAGSHALWRISAPPAAAPLPLAGRWLIEWGGAQRWLLAPAEQAEEIRAAATAAGGHATAFRGGDREGEVFHPLPPGLAALHQRLKQAFDPKGVLNPGRMYSEL